MTGNPIHMMLLLYLLLLHDSKVLKESNLSPSLTSTLVLKYGDKTRSGIQKGEHF